MGGADLEVTAASLVGSDAKEFAIVQAGTPVTLGPDETHDLEIRFAPLSGGNKTAALRLTSDDPNRPTHDVALTGTATTEPDVDVVRTPLDFGEVLVGTTTSRTVAIANVGSAGLQVTAISLSGVQGAEFTVTQGAAPFTVAPCVDPQRRDPICTNLVRTENDRFANQKQRSGRERSRSVPAWNRHDGTRD